MNKILINGLNNKTEIKRANRFYLYEVKKGMFSSVGLVCSVPLSCIERGAILRHEETFPLRASLLYEEMQRDRVQKNPILLISDEDGLERTIEGLLSRSELIQEHQLEQNGIHRLWRTPEIPDQLVLHHSLCVADGHHRLNALLTYYEKSNKANLGSVGIMAAIFCGKQVSTRSKGVILQPLPMGMELFLEKLTVYFKVNQVTGGRLPKQNDEFCMRYKNNWYELALKEEVCHNKTDRLGIEMFNQFMIRKVLGFKGYAENAHLKLVFKECNVTYLEEAIQHPSQVGFIIASDPFEKILSIARQGRILEPNSTYFEPKLLDNVVEQSLDYDY